MCTPHVFSVTVFLSISQDSYCISFIFVIICSCLLWYPYITLLDYNCVLFTDCIVPNVQKYVTAQWIHCYRSMHNAMLMNAVCTLYNVCARGRMMIICFLLCLRINEPCTDHYCLMYTEERKWVLRCSNMFICVLWYYFQW